MDGSTLIPSTGLLVQELRASLVRNLSTPLCTVPHVEYDFVEARSCVATFETFYYIAAFKTQICMLTNQLFNTSPYLAGSPVH